MVKDFKRVALPLSVLRADGGSFMRSLLLRLSLICKLNHSISELVSSFPGDCAEY